MRLQGLLGAVLLAASGAPRSFPPSFNPATILEVKLRTIKVEEALRRAFPMLPEASQPAD